MNFLPLEVSASRTINVYLIEVSLLDTAFQIIQRPRRLLAGHHCPRHTRDSILSLPAAGRALIGVGDLQHWWNKIDSYVLKVK
jgi:hypothetical protein